MFVSIMNHLYMKYVEYVYKNLSYLPKYNDVEKLKVTHIQYSTSTCAMTGGANANLCDIVIV